MPQYAFYVRVSSTKNQDYTRQIEDLYSLTDSQQINRDDIVVFKEKASGYQVDRLQLTTLLGIIEDDKSVYKCIYVTEISRLGRSPRLIREVLNKLEDYKINLHIQKGQIRLFEEDGSYNLLGKLVLDIMINLADEEVRTLKQRSRSGIKSGIKAGRVGGGKYKPYGFKEGEDKMLVIDEKEADVVKFIFNLYKNGKGSKAIANILNNDGIKTRSSKSFGDETVNRFTGKLGNEIPWSDATVGGILKNPIYMGKRRYWGGKENRKNKIPPTLYDINLPTTIVEPELWDECMEIRKTKSHRNYLTEYIYLLKDKLVCGICGRNYFAKYKPTSHGDKVYICSSRQKKGGNCGNIGVNISLLESAIFNEIVGSDSIMKHLNNKDEIKNRLEEEKSSLLKEITIGEKAVNEIDTKIDGALNLQIEAEGKGLFKRVEKHEEIIVRLEREFNNMKKNLSRQNTKYKLIKEALVTRSNLDTTSAMLQDYKSDRVKLRFVYLQIIDKVILNVIDSKTVLANVFISIDGIQLPTSLKLFLDISGVKKKKKVFSYLPIARWSLELEYDDNFILTNDLDGIRSELFIMKATGGMNDIEMQNIPLKNILTIPLKDV